ncbi:hypothetical protein CJU89_3810 [Yarrowia sp. B02]|nr:hypothetical protein CJU89_3810 [Yarrowia sp. B02]
MVSTRSSMRRQSARLERKRELSEDQPIAKKAKIDTNETESVDTDFAHTFPTDDSESESDYDELPSFNYVPKYDLDLGDQLLDLDALTDDISVLDDVSEDTDNTDVSDEEVKEAHDDKPELATDFMDLFATAEAQNDPVSPVSDDSERWPMVDKNEHLSSFSSLNAFIPVPVESVPVSPVTPMAHVAPMPMMPMQQQFQPSLDINDIVDSSACSDSEVSASDTLWTERYNSIPICGFRNSLQRDDSYQSFVKSSMTKSKKRPAHFVVPGINKRSFLSGRAQAMLL